MTSVDFESMRLYAHVMSKVPAVTPDGAKIGRLITERGYTRVRFARTLKRTKVRTIYNIVNISQRTSVELLSEIAAALGVEYGELVASGEEQEPEALAS